MRPEKIISGGQTGADQGALVGAKQIGIPTGGWMPRGFLTEAGPCPALREVYGMQEHPSEKYPTRTEQNVWDSGGTIWVASDDKDSPGRRCTMKAVDKHERPFLVNPTPEMLRAWVETQNIRVLNVAGPRSSRDKKAHQLAADLIINAFGRN